MINIYKIIFTLSMMAGTLISISSYSWMGIWMGLEINLLSIIPLMNNSKNSMSTETSIKYFLTQALASAILLFAILIMFKTTSIVIEMMISSALLTKMGAAPFHFWFPEIIDGLTWSNAFILMTWQKIAPMIIYMLVANANFSVLIIIMSMIIGGLMGLNQVSLRKIMAYSSINHIGWMLSSIMIMETIWLYYFVIYTIISLNLILVFHYTNSFFMKQLFNALKSNSNIKFLFTLNFLSLGGLPPFLGFLPKWITIQALINQNMYTLTLIMVIMTLIPLYFYTRVSLSALTLSSNEMNLPNSNNENIWFIMTFNAISLTSLILATVLFNLI